MNEYKRIQFLNIPVDMIDNDTLTQRLEIMLKDGVSHQIVLLTVGKILRAKFDKEFAALLSNASLILPVSLGIIKGARFQKKGELTRYNPYEFIIKIFSIAESKNGGCYLLGSDRKELAESEKNLRVSFPSLRIVGRCSGYYKKNLENDIKTAIKKASPLLTVVGTGTPGKEKWIFRNLREFKPGIFLWIDNYLDIFAGKEKNISKKLFAKGLESLSSLYLKPWRIFRFFGFLYFKILVLIYRLMKQ